MIPADLGSEHTETARHRRWFTASRPDLSERALGYYPESVSRPGLGLGHVPHGRCCNIGRAVFLFAGPLRGTRASVSSDIVAGCANSDRPRGRCSSSRRPAAGCRLPAGEPYRPRFSHPATACWPTRGCSPLTDQSPSGTTGFPCVTSSDPGPGARSRRHRYQKTATGNCQARGRPCPHLARGDAAASAQRHAQALTCDDAQKKRTVPRANGRPSALPQLSCQGAPTGTVGAGRRIFLAPG